MNVQRFEFSAQAQDVPSLSQYLSKHRRGICGPRTLEQVYTGYRMLLMSKTLDLEDHERDAIQKMDPRKVDWVSAYAWWKTLDPSPS